MILLLFSIGLSSCQKDQDPNTDPLLDIELFGVPSLTPEVFAPGFISTEEDTEFAGTFSPDYSHYFYTKRIDGGTNRLYYTAFIDGAWTIPELSSISEDVSESEPFILNDGSMMYFQSRRGSSNEFAIYQSVYVDGVWQEPVLAEKGLNDLFVMYISVADSGNIYFTSLTTSGAPGIYVIHYIDGVYQPAEYTGLSGAHPYIAPDESFLLFDKGVSSDDYIYISIKEDGIWTSPVRLGDDVNQEDAIQICPSVTPDGKYFFFSRFIDGKSDIYWVDGDYLLQYLP